MQTSLQNRKRMARKSKESEGRLQLCHGISLSLVAINV